MSRARASYRPGRSGDPRKRACRPDHVGFTMGVAATPAEVYEARQATHDYLIKAMGSRRRGGVTWRHATGDDARRIVRNAMEHDPRCAGCLEKLDEWPDAVLVVATAPGLPAG